MTTLQYAISRISLLLIIMSVSALASNEEKCFVVVIPSYNNARWYDRNLQSVLSQNYTNFRVIYTDDRSSDGTGELVEAYLEQNDPDKKVYLIKNSTRQGALHNLYTMIHMSDDNDIIVTLDGDDWFPDNNVLTRLNDIYSSGEIWLTYGQFQMHPSGAQGWASPMPDYIVKNNTFRDFQHLPTHLRTFYSWLFKKIKLEDLLYQGDFYPMTWDQTMMFPMIEMAGERHQFIPDIMYVYNEENNISDHYVSRQLQAHLAQIIRQKNRYKRLAEKPHKTIKTSAARADTIIFAVSAETLSELLASIKSHVQDIDRIFVIYKPTSEIEADEYYIIQNRHPEVEFYLISNHGRNFKENLLTIYQKTDNDYILFTKGDAQFTQELSLKECINALQEMYAYAFYFKLNAQDGLSHYPTMPIVQCKNNIFAWNFALARDKWSSANSLDCVLHKKTAFLAQALQGDYDLTPHGLEMIWANEGNLNRLGLCFNEKCLS